MLPLNIFAIPWGHHKIILDRYESEPMKALFYAVKTLEHSWSGAILKNMMGDKGKDNGLYERQGKAVNNFTDHLSNIYNYSHSIGQMVVLSKINNIYNRFK